MRFRGRVATTIGAVTTALAVLLTVFAAPAVAASGPSFRPGLIISDDAFYNSRSMSAHDIQQFLERRACRPKDGVPCLADYTTDSRSIPDQGAGHCAAIDGRRHEAASSIIARVGVACGINPQVLLVLLQKEQSLLTAPSAAGYAKATGYACPDTASCDKKYLGFFNQVYRAAWQFREYTLHPGEWRYRIGPVPIQYDPDAKCGRTTVRIEDQATANLYNYTPYQPNAQTLAHPTGPAGPCSTFGNLNFSRIFNTWFGSPLDVRYPGMLPACLNYVGGQDCTADRPFDFSTMATGR